MSYEMLALVWVGALPVVWLVATLVWLWRARVDWRLRALAVVAAMALPVVLAVAILASGEPSCRAMLKAVGGSSSSAIGISNCLFGAIPLLVPPLSAGSWALFVAVFIGGQQLRTPARGKPQHRQLLSALARVLPTEVVDDDQDPRP